MSVHVMKEGFIHPLSGEEGFRSPLQCVWSIDIVSSYPVPNGYGDREAIAMGKVGGTGKELHTSLPRVRHLSTNATEVG
jgi:hypothetical protein